MSSEKYSPQLLRSILEAQGIDASGSREASDAPQNASPLELLQRMGALKQLSLMLSRMQKDGVAAAPVPELERILKLLAELAAQGDVPDEEARERKRVLHVAAAILRRLLHGSGTDHYWALGLNRGATPEQVAEHYRMLCKLYWFDEEIDRRQKSRERILEAYNALNGPEPRDRRAGSSRAEPVPDNNYGTSTLRRSLLFLLLPLLLIVAALLFHYRGGEEVPLQPELDLHPGSEAVAPIDVIPTGDEGHEPAPVLAKAVQPDAERGEPETEQAGGTAQRSVEAAKPSTAAGARRAEPALPKPVPIPRKPAATLDQELPVDVIVVTQPPVEGLPPALEQPAAPQPVARSGPVVIGSPDLGVDNLSREQVRALLLGESLSLPGLDRAPGVVLSREFAGGEESFYRRVVGKTPRQFKVHWAKMRFQGKRFPPQRVANDEAVRRLVARNPGIIGIVDGGAVDDSVKVLLQYGD